MLNAEARGAALKLVVTDATKRKEFDISGLEGQELEAVMLEALDLSQAWDFKNEVSVADTLFKNGVPQFIYLQRNFQGVWSFHLRIARCPVTGALYERPILASAAIGKKFTFEQAFEVVWSKLEITLGYFEVEITQPLKWVTLSHFKQQKLYGK